MPVIPAGNMGDPPPQRHATEIVVASVVFICDVKELDSFFFFINLRNLFASLSL